MARTQFYTVQNTVTLQYAVADLHSKILPVHSSRPWLNFLHFYAVFGNF